MNQIKYGAIISYAAILVNFLLGLLYTPWMVHQIGVSDYGLYTLIYAFLSYFLVDFGLGEAIARFISLAVANRDYKRVDNILSTALNIYLIIDFIIFLVLCIAYCFLSDIFGSLTSDEISKLKVVFCIAGFFSLCSFPFTPVNGVLIAYERFVALKSCDLLQKILSVFLSVILLLFGYGLYTLVLIQGAVGLVCALYKNYYARHSIKLDIKIRSFDRSLAKSIFNFSIWVFIIGIAQRLTVNISPTILGMRASTFQISIFAIASTLEGHTWNFANALNGLFMPRVASLSLKGASRKDITDLMIKVGRLQLLMVGLIISGLFIFGKTFLSLWMGSEFESSYFVVLLMVLPGIITLTESIAQTLLYVENEIHYRAILFISSSVISCMISYILADKYGALGCGVGIFFSIIVCHIIGMNFVYRYKLDLDIFRFFRECHLKMLGPILILVIIFYVFQYYYPINSWVSLSVTIVIYTCIYVICMWLCALNEYEKGILKSFISRFIH